VSIETTGLIAWTISVAKRPDRLSPSSPTIEAAMFRARSWRRDRATSDPNARGFTLEFDVTG
jgi:hypothetical protein